MVFQLEARGRQLVHVARAGVDLEDAFADAAAEVVMVAGTCALVAGRFAWQINGCKPAGCHQCCYCSVHRGDTQLVHAESALLQHFSGRKRPAMCFKDAGNGIALARASFHPGNMPARASACSIYKQP